MKIINLQCQLILTPFDTLIAKFYVDNEDIFILILPSNLIYKPHLSKQ